MANHDALRLGRGAGREDHLHDVVTGDRDVRHRRVGAPIEVGERPDQIERSLAWRQARNVVASQDETGIDDGAHAQYEIDRRAIVDGDRDHAHQQTAPVADYPLRAVLAPEHDLVALAETGRGELRRERPRGPADLLITVSTPTIAVVVDEKLASDLGQVAEEVNQRIPLHC